MKLHLCVYCNQAITKYEQKVAPDNWGNYAHMVCWHKYEVEPFMENTHEV
jgi:hypothetical protein